ncbi:MAG: guanylate kinase [Pyrinomonadaceae bacterium]|nr:guanylate kinase [Pyrinomonadaceae bacterium]
MKGNLIIISSPSGGGKGTLIREILRTVPDIGYSVSYTTRKMRDGEVDGKDYIFVSEEKFRELIENGEFLEYATVHGNFYGTSVAQVQKEIAGERDIILEIDVQGASAVLKNLPEAVSIFILPPSFERLRERLIKRATEDLDDLALRLRNSFDEVKRFDEFKYAVINDDLETAANQLATIIIAERLNHTRQMTAIQCILDSFDD